jgi:hypothetical protein
MYKPAMREVVVVTYVDRCTLVTERDRYHVALEPPATRPKN